MTVVAEQFSAYVVGHWTHPDVKDSRFIMLAGFAGEAGEVCSAQMSMTRDELRLELGDFLHYAARIADEYAVSWPEACDYATNTRDTPQPLPVTVGAVCELMKKHVRNNAIDFEKVRAALAATVLSAGAIGEAQGLHLDNIMLGNMAKLDARRAAAGRDDWWKGKST